MTTKNNTMLAMSADVEIAAAAPEENKPATFRVVAYTGGAMELGGWDLPVVVDLDAIKFGRSLIANLDHDRTKRVGHVTSQEVQDGNLVLSGVVSAATDAAREVSESASKGFTWQASIEANVNARQHIKAGETVVVNGRTFNGPLYVTASTLKGFGFVSHGADDETVVSIAATARQQEEVKMTPEVKAWAESMHLDPSTLTEQQVAAIEANYKGMAAPAAKVPDIDDGFARLKAEQERKSEITKFALNQCEGRYGEEIEAIRRMADQAIQAGDSAIEFRLKLMEATTPPGGGSGPNSHRDKGLTNRVLEAAICQAGLLDGYESEFRDQDLQAAHDRFRGRIGLNQLILLCAHANGYRSSYASRVSIEAQRVAFNHPGAGRSISAAGGFSTISISDVLSNVANKFLARGWNAVDDTWAMISKVRPVSDFKEITTVSLLGDLAFEKVGPAGEIKHGTITDETYGNKADTYAKMLAITRQDMINDDLGALTEVPRRLGRGSALTLNDIFWSEFLDNSSFFTSGRNNTSTGVFGASGVDAATQKFDAQTDPDGNPSGLRAKFLLVPPALRGAALRLMNSEKMTGGSNDVGDANIWRDAYVPLSTPYLSNSKYVGYSAVAYYLLADPNDMPVIEVAALNGNVQPVIQTADADFNVLGIQMRGYSDVGVRKQEYRAGVRSTGA